MFLIEYNIPGQKKKLLHIIKVDQRDVFDRIHIPGQKK